MIAFVCDMCPSPSPVLIKQIHALLCTWRGKMAFERLSILQQTTHCSLYAVATDTKVSMNLQLARGEVNMATISFYQIYEHCCAMVLVYLLKCAPFNFLSNAVLSCQICFCLWTANENVPYLTRLSCKWQISVHTRCWWDDTSVVAKSTLLLHCTSPHLEMCLYIYILKIKINLIELWLVSTKKRDLTTLLTAVFWISLKGIF